MPPTTTLTRTTKDNIVKNYTTGPPPTAGSARARATEPEDRTNDHRMDGRINRSRPP